MSGDWWSPKYWKEGNFLEGAYGQDSMVIAVAAPLSEVGSVADVTGSRPGLIDRSTASDALSTGKFTTTSIAGASDWELENSGPYLLPAHFTTTAARDAYAAALAGALTSAETAAVIQNYRDHVVGGYWGSIGAAP